MQLKTEQLKPHLNSTLLPVYLISGEVPLLIQEARDSIIQAAKQKGFTDHQRFSVDKTFNWNIIETMSQQNDLFNTKTLVDIRSDNTAPDKSAKKTLQTYCEHPSNNHLMIITLGKLTASQKNSAWYKALNKSGAVLTIWPVQPEAFLSWIQSRARQLNLQLNAPACHALARNTEGNLLATQQTLVKLQLLYPKQPITDEHIQKIIRASSRYSVFDLGQTVLLGQTQRSQKIIQGLKQEGIDPILVLWSLSREIQALIPLKNKMNQGAHIDTLLTGRWFTRNNALKSALNRISLTTLLQLLKQASHIDLLIKGHDSGNPWLSLSQLALHFCQPGSIKATA